MGWFTKKYDGAQEWDLIKNEGENIFSPKMYRTKIPGGWLVTAGLNSGLNDVHLTFVPDPAHEWQLKRLSDTN